MGLAELGVQSWAHDTEDREDQNEKVWEPVRVVPKEKNHHYHDLRSLPQVGSFMGHKSPMEEMLCDQGKVMPTFPGTASCLTCVYGLCLRKDCIICAADYVITTIFMHEIQLSVIENS